MLFSKFMTEITINAIGMLVDLTLHLAPKKQIKKFELNSDKVPSVGVSYEGWEYREFESQDSGFTHRYFYYPGPSRDAPAFIFLHGLIFDGRNFINTKTLGDKWQLIAYDFPESTNAYRGDMNDFRFLLDDFLDALNIDTIFLCGVSFGGGIAARYAASHARRVKALILVSTFIMNALPSDRIKSRQLARILLKQPDYKLYWLLGKILSRSFRKRNNPLADARELVRIKNLDWYRQVIKAITTCEGPEDAVQIKCPVLNLYGSKDRTVSLKSARSIQQFIPQSKFEIINDGSHAMMYLQGELLSEKIRSFCDKVI